MEFHFALCQPYEIAFGRHGNHLLHARSTSLARSPIWTRNYHLKWKGRGELSLGTSNEFVRKKSKPSRRPVSKRGRKRCTRVQSATRAAFHHQESIPSSRFREWEPCRGKTALGDTGQHYVHLESHKNNQNRPGIRIEKCCRNVVHVCGLQPHCEN